MIKNVRIYYEATSIDEAFDNALENFLKEHGLIRWASGFDLIEKRRDLSFDREEKFGS